MSALQNSPELSRSHFPALLGPNAATALTRLCSQCHKIAFWVLWRSAVLFLILLFLDTTGNGTVHAQAVSDLPRAEYYAARDFYRIGRTVEAAEGFDAALARARRFGDVRWIDSIPPMVMLGECLYSQGNLAQALEQYEAALALAITNPAWIDQIDMPGEQFTEMDFSTKNINWFPKSRLTRSVAIPAGIQVSIDPTQTQVTPSGEILAPISLVTQLDATEVLRTMGIALKRRHELLGPLTRLLPQTQALNELFSRQPAQQIPWLLSSWNVLRGLAALSSGNNLDIPNTLRSGSLVSDEFDYFLTPLASVALGNLRARERNYPAAIVHFQDAIVVAAQFEQFGTMGEAVERLSACAAASYRNDLSEPLQRLAVWANKKSGTLQISSLVGAAELSLVNRDSAQCDKLLKQAALVIRGREAGLPRKQAAISFVSSQLAFAQNRGQPGITSLENGLRSTRGTVATGTMLESVLQTQMTLDLLATNSVTARDAEDVLRQTLAEPSDADWESDPLRAIAEISTERLPGFERLLELAALRAADDATVLERMDRIQRERLYEALPMGGRLFAWRNALDSDRNTLPPSVRKVVETSIQQRPELQSTPERIAILLKQLRAAPFPVDERKMTNDVKKAFSELEQLSASHESQLAFQSLQRKPLERFNPNSANLEQCQQRLADGDLLLGMVTTANHLFGIAITNDSVLHWDIKDRQVLDGNLKQLFKDINLNRDTKPTLPSEVNSTDAAWQKTAEKLCQLLFPADARTQISNAKRIIVAPTEKFWYLPFELLNAGRGPWISHSEVTYIPTLGSLQIAFSNKAAIDETLGIVGSFFALDSDANGARSLVVQNAAPKTVVIPLSQKVSAASGMWLKTRADQVWIASLLDFTGNAWETRLWPFGNPQQAQIGSWLETPRHSPASVLLPGMRTSASKGTLADGNDVFLPACSLMFSGCKSALLSRWPTGGRSAGALLQRYLQDLQDERPSSAMRRAVLSQWAEQFVVSEEPALLPAGNEAATFCSGKHPLLWCGYLILGDYAQP